MKTEPSFSEIGDLLRARTPAATPPPGMEARILRALREEPRRKSAPLVWWPWLAVPAALAAAVLLLPPAAAPDGVAAAEPPAAEQAAALEIPRFETPALATAASPLQSESLALAHDARRMSDFLLDCLPTYSALASAE